jgi:hypothetical protein
MGQFKRKPNLHRGCGENEERWSPRSLKPGAKSPRLSFRSFRATSRILLRRSLDTRCAVVILPIEQAVQPTSLWT